MKQERSTNGWDALRTGIFSIAIIIIVIIAGISWITVSSNQQTITFHADGGIDCNGATDGNLEFDAHTVNLTGKSYWKQESPTTAFIQRQWRYPLTDNVPAETINVPNFQQLKINHIDLRCKANGAITGTIPARMLANAMTNEQGIRR